jgi:tetratricopeptide (TPR) repeat protein
MRPLAAAVLVVVCVLGTMPAQADAPSQDALIQHLLTGSLEERRQAAALLGDVGDGAAIPALLDALKDEDEVLGTLAEHSLWAIWSRSGDPRTDALLQEGIHLVQSDRVDEAVEKFNEVVKAAPGFAEGYNWRARAYYLMGDYERAIADCEEALTRNPMHFGALSGEGFSYLELGRPTDALRYFERALAINPNKPKIKSLVNELRELAQQRIRDSI